MAYEPTEWKAGDVITGSKMNKIEAQLAANTEEIEEARGKGGSASGTLGARIDDMIILSDTQPTSTDNEIWIRSSSSGGVVVPTYEELENVRDSIAEVYDSAKTYAIGDYVYYNGKLYRCNTTISTAEAWTAAHWTETQVGDDVQELKSALDQAIEDFAIPTQEAVDNWLDEHPEATTTVQDNSLTETKFTDALKLKTIKDYVTPETYGAVGDGITDDITAIQNAINSGKSVKLSKKTYLISSPLYVDSFTTILGDSAGWNGGGTVIKASEGFSGDYMFIISHNTNDYCRSVNIYDINLNCNSITGGINAIHLYDASIFKNINITRIGANHYGINIEYKGHVTQTLTCCNVICVADTVTQRDGTKAIIHLERLQECTLINVRAFANNSNAFDIFGCETLTMISCATYDYANIYKAFNFGVYAKEGFAPHYTRNITMIGCLNEGNPMGLYIDGKYQALTGTFTEYTSGVLVTQNNVRGVISSGSASMIIIYPISGEFVTGTCSVGEITEINDRYSGGFEINYQPKLSDLFSSVTVKGVSNSTIKVNKTIGYSTGIDYTVENNYCTKIVVAPDDVHSMNTDYTSEISLQSPVVIFTNRSGSNIQGLPTVAFEGLTVIIYSTKDKYDCRLMLPIASIYNGTKYLGFNYFTKAVLKVVNGYFIITECDGSVLDKTNNIFVWDGDVKKNTLASRITDAKGFITNMHYFNEGAQEIYTINTNAMYVGRKIIVTSVNNNAITVNFQNGTTLPDGTTTSVVVNAGETKTFISLTSGIFNVQ